MKLASDPFVLLGQAKSILVCRGDRTDAINLGLAAIDRFEAQKSLEAQSTRNAVLRLGMCEILSALHAKTENGLSWVGISDCFTAELVGAIMMADDIRFLEEMISFKCPILVLKKQIRAFALKRQDIATFQWICLTMINRGGSRSVLNWMIDLSKACPVKMSPGLAELWIEILPLIEQHLYAHSVYDQQEHNAKIAAVLVLSNVSQTPLQRMLKAEDLECEVRRILTLGASSHGRLTSKMREPSLSDILARSSNATFVSAP